MKRDIYIQVIKDYILEKPGRPYAEVQNYANEVNASNEELKQAILEAKDEIQKNQATSQPRQIIHKAPPKKPLFSLPKMQLPAFPVPALAVRAVTLISLSGIMILTISSVYLFVRVQSLSQQLNSTSGEPVASSILAPQVNSLISTVVHPVYANQKMVNADEIFSYPASDITLKYSGRPQKEIFGFFPYWMIDVWNQIELTGLTDVAIFGLTTDGRGNIVTASDGTVDPGWDLWQDPELDRFIQSARRKKIRLHITIKCFNNTDIETLVASDENQTRFIANAIQLTNSKSLEGINIDFEYVGTADAKTKEGFTRLIANLNAELKRQNPNAMLSVDTYVAAGAEAKFFDIKELAPHSDRLVIMGYDVHTPSGSAGPVAPLEGAGGLSGYLQSYLDRVDAGKLILALPYYGYDWPVNPAPGIEMRAQSKILPYAAIAQASKGSKIFWNETSQTPYYQYKDPETGVLRVVHFDNARSLGLKYDYINNKNFAGAGIWALGYDGLNRELHQVLLDKFSE